MVPLSRKLRRSRQRKMAGRMASLYLTSRQRAIHRGDWDLCGCERRLTRCTERRRMGLRGERLSGISKRAAADAVAA